MAGSPFLVLDALHMLALNDAGHEEEWAAEGFDVLDGSRDPRVLRWGVALHNNLGWTMHDGGRRRGGARASSSRPSTSADAVRHGRAAARGALVGRPVPAHASAAPTRRSTCSASSPAPGPTTPTCRRSSPR